MQTKKQVFSQKISVAPMLDWTDRHFRYFIRLITNHATLYTEMVAVPALVLGNRDQLLQYNANEHPVILQVGGSDPKQMALCAKMAEEYGYDGININAGCPSSRVQSGRFGAVLIEKPEIVAECVAHMKAASKIPVSVKTRIALESRTSGDGFAELLNFADLVKKAGCAHLIVHARKAKLNWSPKDNRARLPLDYDVVYRLKRSFPDMPISINGNIMNLDEAEHHLQYVDGAMLGRVVYGNPYALAETDARFYNDGHPILTRTEVLQAMLPYLQEHENSLTVILPHLMGLFHGTPVSKKYKQLLNERDIKAISAFAVSSEVAQASRFPLK